MGGNDKEGGYDREAYGWKLVDAQAGRAVVPPALDLRLKSCTSLVITATYVFVHVMQS